MADPLRLTRLVFTAGPKRGATPLTIPVSPIVLLVGPNNSGKSAALSEIDGLCMAGHSSGLVIQSIDLNYPVEIDAAVELLSPLLLPLPEVPKLPSDTCFFRRQKGRLEGEYIK